MRLIAQEAGVAQALLHYHFNTKERLFEAIFARRSTAINAFREERLDKLFAGDNNPTLEDLLDVLFQPSSEFSRQHDATGNVLCAYGLCDLDWTRQAVEVADEALLRPHCPAIYRRVSADLSGPFCKGCRLGISFCARRPIASQQAERPCTATWRQSRRDR